MVVGGGGGGGGGSPVTREWLVAKWLKHSTVEQSPRFKLRLFVSQVKCFFTPSSLGDQLWRENKIPTFISNTLLSAGNG